jgi:hypothetical protein
VPLPRWIPHPSSWAASVALFLYGLGISFGWLAFLGLWVAPIPAAAFVHRAAQGVLDLADGGVASNVRGSSLWAGFFAWITFMFVTITTSLILLVLDPPPVDPGAMFTALTEIQRGGAGITRVALWIVLAAYAYELERGVRASRA